MTGDYEFLHEDENVPEEEKAEPKPKKKSKAKKATKRCKVLLITPTKVVYEDSGSGVSIPFDSKKHKDLVIGSEIEVE